MCFDINRLEYYSHIDIAFFRVDFFFAYAIPLAAAVLRLYSQCMFRDLFVALVDHLVVIKCTFFVMSMTPVDELNESLLSTFHSIVHISLKCCITRVLLMCSCHVNVISPIPIPSH